MRIKLVCTTALNKSSMFFWSIDFSTDILLALGLLTLFVPAYFASRVEQFFVFILQSLLYDRVQFFFNSLPRCITKTEFVVWGHLHTYLLITFNLYILSQKSFFSFVPLGITNPLLLFFCLFLGTLLGAGLFGLFFSLVRYIYLKREQGIILSQYAILSEWIWSIFLYASALVSLSPLHPFWGTGILIISYLFWRLFVLSYAWRALKGGIQLFHLFLYLCAREIAPVAFILSIVWLRR